MVRRLKSEITNWDGTPKFAKREALPIEVPYTDEEKRIHALLARYSEIRAAGRPSSSHPREHTSISPRLRRQAHQPRHDMAASDSPWQGLSGSWTPRSPS